MPERDPDRFNGPFMRQHWAEANRLVAMSHPSDIRVPLESLVDGRRAALIECARSLHGLDYAVFDHDSYFSAPGRPGRVAAVVTAPYLGAVRRGLSGGTAELNATAHKIARDLELFVRVGHPADTIHLSRWPNEPTVPIVWWHPDRVNLDIPPLADPYPQFDN